MNLILHQFSLALLPFFPETNDPVSPAEGHQRFTLNGNRDLENHLLGVCRELVAAVQQVIPARRFEGLVLGGGYGRGEGGVLRTNEGDRPYNDMEFYLFLRGHPRLNERRYQNVLISLAESLTRRAGVEIELKIISRRHLQQSPASMFYYDLVQGHRRLAGPPELLENCEQHGDPSLIPPSEASRLLMNRFTGLLLARERLEAPSWNDAQADFVERNQAKAMLAMGDAVLTLHHQYHWSCRMRHQRLNQFSHPPAHLSQGPWDTIRRLHRQGVSFKLHPYRSQAPQHILAKQNAFLIEFALPLWLWCESLRLQQRFRSLKDYLDWPQNKCPEIPRWKNPLIHVRQFGPLPTQLDRAWRYPRERLFHALSRLLWQPDIHLPGTPLWRQLQAELNSHADQWPEMIEDYHRLWTRFN